MCLPNTKGAALIPGIHKLMLGVIIGRAFACLMFCHTRVNWSHSWQAEHCVFLCKAHWCFWQRITEVVCHQGMAALLCLGVTAVHLTFGSHCRFRSRIFFFFIYSEVYLYQCEIGFHTVVVFR